MYGGVCQDEVRQCGCVWRARPRSDTTEGATCCGVVCSVHSNCEDDENDDEHFYCDTKSVATSPQANAIVAGVGPDNYQHLVVAAVLAVTVKIWTSVQKKVQTN